MVPQLVHSTASIDRLDELDADSNNEKRLQNSIVIQEQLGLRLKNVNFAYTQETNKNHREIIGNFSHDFAPGSKTAIMGETGKGKTTLFRLLLGFIKPDNGEILIYLKNGGDAKACESFGENESPVSDETRPNFVYVPQGNTLMNGSVRYNLQLAKPDATDDEMRKALHIACADFVFDFAEGLDFELGERARGLSEGQAQRIAIARGLLRPGNILLLDEISSSLDETTEADLYKRLFEAFPAKTMIFVTHRTAVCELCDETVRL